MIRRYSRKHKSAWDDKHILAYMAEFIRLFMGRVIYKRDAEVLDSINKQIAILEKEMQNQFGVEISDPVYAIARAAVFENSEQLYGIQNDIYDECLKEYARKVYPKPEGLIVD